MNLFFIKVMAVRAIKTAAQAALALIGAEYVGIASLDWAGILAVSATAGVVSILSTLTSLDAPVESTPAGRHRQTQGKQVEKEST